MDSTLWSAVIGGAVTLIVFGAGAATSSLREKASSRDAMAAQARVAVQELIRAGLDLQVALAMWEARWRDKRTIASSVARSVAQMLAGYAEDRAFRGTADAVASAMEWRRAADAAEEAIVAGPMSRMTAAAAQIAMLDDADLRVCSSAVTDALGKLAALYAERPRPAARAAAVSDLEEAIGKLSAAARAYDGRSQRRSLLRPARP